MSDASVSTIAQLVFAEPQPLNFARVVGDLHTVLSRFRGQNLRIEWDCEDIAIFDLAEARIMLAWNDQPGKGYSACLSVSVGPLPYAPPDLAVQAGHESMCSRLIERLQARFPATAILWHQTDQPITPDVLDRLVDSLPALMELFPFQEPDWMAEAIAEPAPPQASPQAPQPEARIQPEAPPPLPPRAPAPRRFVRGRKTMVANDMPHLPRMRNIELSRVRAALYDPVEDAPAQGSSAQLRLATYAMNTTLIVVWLPLGAAVMTYGLLKGADINLSARLLVATGTVVGLMQSPFGHTVAAMAGV